MIRFMPPKPQNTQERKLKVGLEETESELRNTWAAPRDTLVRVSNCRQWGWRKGSSAYTTLNSGTFGATSSSAHISTMEPLDFITRSSKKRC